MSKRSTGSIIYRKDYAPYPWRLRQVRLHFEIGADAVEVRSVLDFERREGRDESSGIHLDGQDMELLSVSVDGRALVRGEYRLDKDGLTIFAAPDRCRVEIAVRIDPWKNTALEGLYASGDFLVTQCEAEGFRKITYFPDRPDVMTRYEVTVVADREHYPVLLSNGNPVDSGVLDGGRHWIRWEDPFPKPCYLFALVAGDLACVEDRFITQSGREVVLRIFVEKENEAKCGHAMESLIRAMRWDEERFGLEYDLDIYNIVATNDFNMGAMENKSLNIFNSKYVLARPETATDDDYQGIEGVIGHEYFHNWTGNRVTCRDWFQLTLKEGLTVFRDQEFSSDMQSRAVKRIRDVRYLRARQFPEDSGPMSHPIRPDKYQEINNFYTMTVYQKGAEVIRMCHTLVGGEGFRKGLRLYFERHDGQAVTCDDFLAAMADANAVDLEQFGRWYEQSGTPVVTVRGSYDAERKRYTLNMRQHTPPTHDQTEKRALVIPVAVGLLSREGEELPLQRAGEGSGGAVRSRVLLLTAQEQDHTFENVASEPIPSLLRGFSAPVKLEYPYSDADLSILLAHDSDSFVQWEAAQQLAQRQILANVARRQAGEAMRLDAALASAFGRLLAREETDPALIAEALILPDEGYLGEQMETIDADGIHAARRFVKSTLAGSLEETLTRLYAALASRAPYDKSPQSMARRALRNACLSYLMETQHGESLATAQFGGSDNMTDSLAALRALVWSESPAAVATLKAFEERWSDDPLVMDKWFSIQAATPTPQAAAIVRRLMQHPAFSIHNPNKVRSVLGAFSMSNPVGFHSADGAGYRLLADSVIELNAINPQVAARMVSAFNSWSRYDSGRRKLMEMELERIASASNLSPDVAEIVRNALEMKAP